jgi:Heparinase II/III-like protein/Heparinase II/III N-terminus
MDFLLQPDMEKSRGIKLINHYVQKLTDKSTGLEPYPISCRGTNWIKFLTKHGIQIPEIKNSLFAQYNILLDNLEYNLLGNHLLENGFSLLFGAFYYNNLRLYIKADKLIKTELSRQILEDGGHFELSPMYHQIILERVLDCINLLQNNKLFDGQESLLTLINEKAIKILQWLNIMTFSNGDIPLFNDSATGISPSTQQLNDYAIRLELISEGTIRQIRLNSCNSCLKDSGYRRFNGLNYECIIDVGQIGPDYQPGHAHADTFNFELYLFGKPVIVDTGTSTYEKNERRQFERSTSSHNTIQLGIINSSEVWGGFRVARRAKVILLEENNFRLAARHNGYKHIGLIHEREFLFEADEICITDKLIGDNQLNAVSRFHFSPDLDVYLFNNQIEIKCYVLMMFEGFNSIRLVPYEYASAFNQLISSIVCEIDFDKQLSTTIKAICCQ